MYDAGILRALDSLIREPILVISDGPYRPQMYHGREPPETLRIIRRSVLAWSWSKAMAIAGERIAFLAIPPYLAEAAALRNACIFAMKMLGSIHATALWRLVVAHAPDATIDVARFK